MRARRPVENVFTPYSNRGSSLATYLNEVVRMSDLENHYAKLVPQRCA